jgi:hypothetical protein
MGTGRATRRHRTDDSPECPVNNEEIYYFRIGVAGSSRYSAEGFGMHRTYTPDGSIDVNVVIHDGDVFCVPRGYHGPCIAAPGYPMYYLNVLAGPGRRTVDGVLRRPGAPLGPRHMGRHGHRSPVPDDDEEWTNRVSKTLGIGVIGFGWMGQAHSRGCRRAPSYFLQRDYEPELVVVSDTVEARRDDAVRSFGYQTCRPPTGTTW